MNRRRSHATLTLLLSFLMTGLPQTRTEARTLEDAPRAGGPISGLTPDQQQLFILGSIFAGVPHSVLGTEPGAPANALGPRFNGVSCTSCHAHPSLGGTSPSVNPQVELATHFGATNKVPFFIKENGPIREARFRFKKDGSPDGGVHAIYTITGRQDAGSCVLGQPDFEAEARVNNLSFRIPTPMFGLGMVEMISDSTILGNKNADSDRKRKLRIKGKENRNGNDGTISRFGWKAQNVSLEMFSAEAYNVETGVTNDIFQTERDETSGCALNPRPEDTANFSAPPPFAGLSAMVAFVQFNKFLAPPSRGTETDSTRNGERLFSKVGCALCHTPTLTTDRSPIAAFDSKPVNLYSDLLLHRMGPDLADHITQGDAGPDEFRTAPLWGVGQRLFFLHDGRTDDLMTAIRAHASGNVLSCRSEANHVIKNFKALSEQEKQDIVNFLRIL